MEKRIEEPEVLETIQDHFELLASLVGMSAEVLDNGDNKLSSLEKKFVDMVTEVTGSLKKRCHYIIKQSARFHKKPSIWQRIRDLRAEKREAKELKRLQDAEYREFLAQKRAKEEEDEGEVEDEEPNQGEDTPLPALRQECPVDILDAENAEGEEEISSQEE